MAENVSSSVLFHFTSRMENLVGILRRGFLPKYCPEYGLDDASRKAADKRRPPLFAIPMVCFCDLPISLIGRHLKEYGPYGIGLKKAWGIQSGVSPVFYSHQKARTVEAIARLTGKPDRGDCRADANALLLSAHMKPFEGPAWRRNRRPAFQPEVRFYDEREWRYIPCVPSSDTILPWQEYRDESRRDRLNKGLEHYSLPVDPDAVMYLILREDKSENSLIRLHRQLRKLFGEENGILLTTTIITEDCIQQDV